MAASRKSAKRSNAFLNLLTGPLGITIRSDSVVRTLQAGGDLFHPKEALIRDAALAPMLARLGSEALSSAAAVAAAAATTAAAASSSNKSGSSENASRSANNLDLSVQGRGLGIGASSNPSSSHSHSHSDSELTLVYPFGVTLDVSRPAVPILTSGDVCFPAERAVGAMVRVEAGLLVVLGAAQVFSDSYVSREDNAKLLLGLMRLLTTDRRAALDAKMNGIDESAPEFAPRREVPDVDTLSERLRSCLQESEELPAHFAQLFHESLFEYGTELVPEVTSLYKRLRVKQESLTVIEPQFEVPHPPLQPAVFLPTMRDLPPPALDLFDLDEHFASDHLRLAQLTNKCTDRDLGYFVLEAGEITGVTPQLPDGKRASAMHVLHHVLKQLTNYKKMVPDAN